MKYKFSRYNHFGKLESGNVLVYNVLSSGVAVMSDDEFNAISRCAPDANDEELFCAALDLGFLVPEAEDELAKVITLRNANNYNDKRAGFQILPTTGCNARCFYCYEQGFRSSAMTDETVGSTIRFILDYCENMDEVNIAWFGGEPFTQEKRIAEISHALIEEFDRRGVKYNANVITNGALISEKNIDAIVNDYRISSVQITLDGRGVGHTSRKAFVDKTVTYDTILNSIALLSKHGVHVMVRINIDKTNFEECLGIFDDLNRMDADFENVWPYVAPLYSDKEADMSCFKSDELAEVFANAYIKMIDTGYIQTINGLPMNFQNATCCAKMVNNFVISPEGNISKCEHLLDVPDEIIGHVSTGIVFNKAMAKWCSSDIPEPCKECSYLPVCQAGCSAAETRGFGYGRCSYVAFIHDAVISAANYLMKKACK